ncbi:nucleic acid binding protein [Strigomonas culicis]|nr:nucleic acid binding protein [Strigomonas culicis]|eukprot:EPY21486.1 nucleic acid binding protein [Strigomonas culicis]
MVSITFRLKSSNYVGTIDIKGNVISYQEALEAIASKISAQPDEIRVFMAGSTALLHPEEHIPAYAAVEVVRESAAGKAPTRPRAPPPGAHAGRAAAMAAPASANKDSEKEERHLTEEERLAQLQNEVALDTGISEVQGRFRREAPHAMQNNRRREENLLPPPDGYICHNCGKGGHFIQHCPSARNGGHLKELSLPLGIPESMLEECSMDDPAPKFITRDHRIVKRRLDASALYSVASLIQSGTRGEDGVSVGTATADGDGKGQDDKPAEGGADQGNRDAYLCIVDGVLAKNAVKTQCCGKLLCADCFDQLLSAALDSDDGEPALCPHCKELLLLDSVAPALEARQVIETLARKKRPREE